MLYFLPLIVLIAVWRIISSAIKNEEGSLGKELTTILAAHISRRTGRSHKESGAWVRIGLRVLVAIVFLLILAGGF